MEELGEMGWLRRPEREVSSRWKSLEPRCSGGYWLRGEEAAEVRAGLEEDRDDRHFLYNFLFGTSLSFLYILRIELFKMIEEEESKPAGQVEPVIDEVKKEYETHQDSSGKEGGQASGSSHTQGAAPPVPGIVHDPVELFDPLEFFEPMLPPPLPVEHQFIEPELPPPPLLPPIPVQDPDPEIFQMVPVEGMGEHEVELQLGAPQ
ncbi:hypothetical protein AgCh_016052 [Apium graveolens]